MSVGRKLNTINNNNTDNQVEKSCDVSNRKISPLILNYRKPADPDLIIPVRTENKKILIYLFIQMKDRIHDIRKKNIRKFQ